MASREVFLGDVSESQHNIDVSHPSFEVPPINKYDSPPPILNGVEISVEQKRAANLGEFVFKNRMKNVLAEEYASSILRKEQILATRGFVSHGQMNVAESTLQGLYDLQTYQAKEANAKKFVKIQRKDALEAFKELDLIYASSDNTNASLTKFRKKWGYASSDFERLYQKMQKSVTSLKEELLTKPFEETEDTRKALVGYTAQMLKSLKISKQDKLKILELGGYSRKDAILACNKILASVGITFATTHFAEFTGLAVSAYQAAHPDLKDLHLSPPADYAIAGASYGAFYGMTALYAMQCLRMLKKTGFSPNAYATSAFHIGGMLLSENSRDKLVIGTMVSVNLLWDAVYGSPLVNPLLTPDIRASMTTGANGWGVIFTAGQIAACEPIIQIANAIEKQKALKEFNKPGEIRESTYPRGLDKEGSIIFNSIEKPINNVSGYNSIHSLTR